MELSSESSGFADWAEFDQNDADLKRELMQDSSDDDDRAHQQDEFVHVVDARDDQFGEFGTIKQESDGTPLEINKEREKQSESLRTEEVIQELETVLDTVNSQDQQFKKNDSENLARNDSNNQDLPVKYDAYSVDNEMQKTVEEFGDFYLEKNPEQDQIEKFLIDEKQSEELFENQEIGQQKLNLDYLNTEIEKKYSDLVRNSIQKSCRPLQEESIKQSEPFDLQDLKQQEFNNSQESDSFGDFDQQKTQSFLAEKIQPQLQDDSDSAKFQQTETTQVQSDQQRLDNFCNAQHNDESADNDDFGNFGDFQQHTLHNGFAFKQQEIDTQQAETKFQEVKYKEDFEEKNNLSDFEPHKEQDGFGNFGDFDRGSQSESEGFGDFEEVKADSNQDKFGDFGEVKADSNQDEFGDFEDQQIDYQSQQEDFGDFTVTDSSVQSKDQTKLNQLKDLFTQTSLKTYLNKVFKLSIIAAPEPAYQPKFWQPQTLSLPLKSVKDFNINTVQLPKENKKKYMPKDQGILYLDAVHDNAHVKRAQISTQHLSDKLQKFYNSNTVQSKSKIESQEQNKFLHGLLEMSTLYTDINSCPTKPDEDIDLVSDTFKMLGLNFDTLPKQQQVQEPDQSFEINQVQINCLEQVQKVLDQIPDLSFMLDTKIRILELFY